MFNIHAVIENEGCLAEGFGFDLSVGLVSCRTVKVAMNSRRLHREVCNILRICLTEIVRMLSAILPLPVALQLSKAHKITSGVTNYRIGPTSVHVRQHRTWQEYNISLT